jgi:preprotein translocase subunit SecD
MKNTTISLLLVLFTSACSHKTETTPTTSTGDTTPQFAIAAGDVTNTSVEVVTGRVPSSPTQEMAVVHLELLGAKAAEFRQFTKDHINQKVQIMVGTKVVEEPVIRAEIPSPKIELMFSSPDEARVIADSLSKK